MHSALVVTVFGVALLFLALTLVIVLGKAWRELREGWRRARRRVLEPLVLQYAHGSSASIFSALGGGLASRDRLVVEQILLDHASRVRVETNAGFADFSDGNTRVSADAGAWYVWPWPKQSLSWGGVVRYSDYSDNFDNGYFDPQNWIAAVMSLRSDGSIGGSAWSYEAAVEAGTQSFTLDGVDASGELLWNVHALVARPLPRGFSFHIFADFGNSSAASGPGYRSRSGGFRVRWTIGD